MDQPGRSCRTNGYAFVQGRCDGGPPHLNLRRLRPFRLADAHSSRGDIEFPAHVPTYIPAYVPAHIPAHVPADDRADCNCRSDRSTDPAATPDPGATPDLASYRAHTSVLTGRLP